MPVDAVHAAFIIGAPANRQNLSSATHPVRPQRKSYDGSEQVAKSTAIFAQSCVCPNASFCPSSDGLNSRPRTHMRGCLKSPGRSRLTVRGPGFAPAVWKLEWET